MASANNLVRFKDQAYTVETPELGLDENSLAVEEAYGAQQIRGGQPGYWDDAEAGIRVVMSFSNRSRSKQVRLAVFDSEPMARLAEQRLRESGIPSLTRSLRGGPAIWGSAYNLPHDLYVYEADQELARQVLELPDAAEGEEQETPARANWGIWLAVAIITLTLALGIIVPLISQSG